MEKLINATLNGKKAYEGKAYFFKGQQYLRYDWEHDKIDPGYPKSLSEWNLPGEFNKGIDAALNGLGKYEGKAYFFRGGQYVSYDWSDGKISPESPLPIYAWGLPEPFSSGIDAAFNGYGKYAGKAYFFKGNRYARYDWAKGVVDFADGDLAAWKLPSPCSLAVDSALEGVGRYEKKAYFFRNGMFVRYDWPGESGDADYPLPLHAWKLPSNFLYPQPAKRDQMLFVTIDDSDYFQWNNDGHFHNLKRLKEIAAKERVKVDPIWMGNLTDDLLQDPSLLALLGAGSFPEWYKKGSGCWGCTSKNKDWWKQLDRYGVQLKNINLPVFAVCGTHQLIAKAFQDWDAVGHMMPGGQKVPSIGDEFREAKSLIPGPRLGEVGKFPFNVNADSASDPIFKGLSGRLWFKEYHHDQVTPGKYCQDFKILLQPDYSATPSLDLSNTACHLNPASNADRCAVQLLRLSANDRILYTSQFHPELATGDETADIQSEQLLRNFLKIAQRFWKNKQ